MQWHKLIEYTTVVNIDDVDYMVTARKEGCDEEYAIEIDREYVTDSETLPDREFIKKLISDNKEIESRVGYHA